MKQKMEDVFAKQTKTIKQTAVTTSVNELVVRVLKLMRSHIGESNKISRRQLFTRIYKFEPELVSELQEYMLWELLKRAMHRCRQQSYCFIVSKLIKQSAHSAQDRYGGVWHYWVAEDISDFHIYRDNINRNINAMRRMVARCERAIDQEWHKRDWYLDWQLKNQKKV